MKKSTEKVSEGELPETVSAGALALLTGYTARQIRNLASEGIVVKAGRGLYELASSVANILNRAEVRGADEGAEVRTGYLRARKEALEVATAERRRELMPAAEVRDILDFTWAAIRDEIAGLPARLTRDPVERRRLEREIGDARNRIAARLEKAADQFRPGGATPPAVIEEEANDE